MIKKSYVDCSNCPLCEQSLVLPETNCEYNLRDVNLLIIGEAPAIDEVKNKKPFVGRAGSILRKYLELYNIYNYKYMITNIVLCSNLKTIGNKIKTFTPPKESIELCMNNLLETINITNPNLIVMLGNTVKTAFNINGSMKEVRGKIFKLKYGKINKEIDTLITYHPSFIIRGNINSMIEKTFAEDIEYINTYYSDTKNLISSKPISKSKKVTKSNKVYLSDLNEFLSSDRYLLDVQNLYNNNNLLVITKDGNNNKYFDVFNFKDYYYIIKNTPSKNSPILNDIKNVKLVINNNRNDIDMNTHTYYEQDVTIDKKFTIDYYLQKENEIETTLKKLYCDIEVFRGVGVKEFPNAIEAKYPINFISHRLNTELNTNVWYVRPNESIICGDRTIESCNIKVFETEIQLLEHFCKYIQQSKPDIITGWNFIDYDMCTIINRMLKLNMNINNLSPIGKTAYKSTDNGTYISLYGTHVVDMLKLYKKFTQNVEDSYKLDHIAMKHLKVGKDKLDVQQMDGLYLNKDTIDIVVNYSKNDTNRIYELDKKIKHTDLLNEIRRISSTTMSGAEGTLSSIDPLCISFAKKNNMVSKNLEHTEKSSFSGAFVANSRSGLYDYIIDIDYASLYPRIVITFNIGPETYIAKVNENIAYNNIYDINNLPDNIEITYNPLIDNNIHTISKDEFLKFINDNEGITNISGCIFKGHNKGKSLLSKIMNTLLEKRSIEKDKYKVYKRENNPLWTLYYSKQWAWKILANACFHPDTEVLTLNGIKNIKDINIGDKLLSVNTITKCVEIDEVVNTINYNYDDYMINFKSTGYYDQCVTKDHKLILENSVGISYEECSYDTYKYLQTKTEKYICTYNKINNVMNDKYYYFIDYFYKYSHRIPIVLYIIPNDQTIDLRIYKRKYIQSNIDTKLTKFIYKSKSGYKCFLKDLSINEIEYIKSITNADCRLKVLDSYNIKSRNNNTTIPIKIDYSILCKYIGYYVSEGNLYESIPKRYKSTYRGISKSITISQYIKINPIIYKDIENVVNTICSSYSKWNKGIKISNNLLYIWTYNECNKYSHNKQLPDMYTNLSTENIFILFKSLIAGDGDSRYNINRRGRYTTNSIKLRDQISNICILLGYLTKYTVENRNNSNYYRIYFQKYKRGNITIQAEHISKTKYNGKVYCITVKNNHNLFAGLNGKFNVIGNCYGALSNNYCRLYSLDLAKAITIPGQELNKFAGLHLSKYMENGNTKIIMNYLKDYENIEKPYLVYQDTDSAFLNMGMYLKKIGIEY